MQHISLSNTNKYFIIDDQDFDLGNKYPWRISSFGYVIYEDWIDHKYTRLFFHRLIIKPPDGMETDHINGNKLDNRKCNLRICTTSQNQANSKPQKNNTFGYKGIWLNKNAKKFVAAMMKDGKRHYCGYFNTPEEAAMAYNELATNLFGDFAKLNIINKGG